MDNKVLINNSTLMGIADSIRDQLNTTETMRPSDMPGFINRIDAEKVTIDGEKVTESLDLFVHQHTMDFTPTENMPSIFSKHYIFSSTIDTYNSSRFSYLSEDIITGEHGTSLINYPLSSTMTSTQITVSTTFNITDTNGTEVKIPLPKVTIPSTSEYPTNSSAKNSKHCWIVQNHLQDFYLIVCRFYMKNINSTKHVYGNGYMTIFKLMLDTTNYSNSYWVEKCNEIRFFASDSAYGSPDFPNQYNQSIYIDDNEAILFGSSGKTSSYFDTGVYIFNFNEKTCTFVDTSSIFGNYFHSNISDGFVTKIQDKIYLYQTEENVSKCVEIDANTYTIIKSINAPSFYTTNTDLVCQGVFMHNNKLYFNGTQNGVYYLYEFVPSTWDTIKLVEIDNTASSCLLTNKMPLYVYNSEFYYHFNLEEFRFLGPYYLPTIPEIPQEWKCLLEGVNVDDISYSTRYFFLPQYNYLLVYQRTVYDYNGGTSYLSLYKVYIRRLDNKPLTYILSKDIIEGK